MCREVWSASKGPMCPHIDVPEVPDARCPQAGAGAGDPGLAGGGRMRSTPPQRRIGTALTAIGAVLTAAGAAMYVLPGPGLPVLVIGLAVLTTGLVMATAGHRS